MSVSLKAAAAAAPAAAPDKYRPEPDPDPRSGADLVRRARGVVATVARPYRVSEYERDALVSELVCQQLAEQRGEVATRDPFDRVRDLIRDSRAWRDVAGDQWRRERSKQRPHAPAVAPEVAREAERHADYERREVSLSDLADGGDYLMAALDREREAAAPPVAADAREVAESVAATLREAGTISEAERAAVLVALLMAHGVPLSTVAADHGYALITAKRRSAKGAAILRERVAPGELVALRERAALALGLADDRPDAHAAIVWAASQAVARAGEGERQRLACVMAGGGSEPHGPSMARVVRRRYRSHRAAVALGW